VVVGVARPRGVEKADSTFGHGGKDGKIDLKVKQNEGKTADNAESADIERGENKKTSPAQEENLNYSVFE
jgi:hypothetical protein